jgi:Domain of unknown function (DUF4397)
MSSLLRRALTGTAAVLAVTTALAGTGGAALAAAPQAGSAEGDGRVFIVQALPGDVVSVTVDGEEPSTGVATSDILGPLELSPGPHDVSVQSEGDEDWMLETTVQVAAGRTLDVVLHRPAAPNGDPVVTVYQLPLEPVAPDKGRVLLAHTATVPPADVLVDGALAFANIANGEFVDAEVPTGEHSAEIVPTGRSGPALLGPLPLEITPKTLTSVYAIGRPEDRSMDVIVHQLPVPQRGSDSPDDIETGSAGLVAGVQVEGLVDTAAPTAAQTAAPATAEHALFALSWSVSGALAALALALMITPVAVTARVRVRSGAGGPRNVR